MINQEKIIYKGQYKQYDSRGFQQIYNTGDVVIYDGNQYMALQNNVTSIPTKNRSQWRLVAQNIDGFHYSATLPITPTIGDRWVDTTNGRMYTYTEDKTGFHWVEF
jgi:hypothetical protein